MITDKKKKLWLKPELIIIDRIHKEESVLLTCFSGSPPSNPKCPNVEQAYRG